ncbi:SDR family NAD(P)-dependent oxidoreductase [Salipiger aestuarii]|uniref:SDR family NAD(P)-dependent oxidoreductase n=1 Tax=Salipiger aestuarii TaxID=568098 RepID=UPI001CC28776|nr:SDR family NAD(P)-dependent oxidoreductase [Salipiger aestuarii]
MDLSLKDARVIVTAGPTGRIEQLDLAQVEQCLSICLTSQFVTTSRAVPHLRAGENASIVNVSSLAGRLGFRLRSPYAAAKWGAVGLSKSMAIELGPDDIRVNALLPPCGGRPSAPRAGGTRRGAGHQL